MAQAESPGAPVSKKEYTLEDSDPFWAMHSTAPFPKVAEEVEDRLRGIMTQIHVQCVQYGSDGEHVDYVRGANIAGYLKVANAMLAQGTL